MDPVIEKKRKKKNYYWLGIDQVDELIITYTSSNHKCILSLKTNKKELAVGDDQQKYTEREN
jgi:hypothetical protein